MSEEQGVINGVSKSMLRQMMLIFLFVISGAVVGINGWTLWNSYQRMLTTMKESAHNLSISLSRQAEDTFLQTELTLQDLRDRINLVGFQHQSIYLTQLLQRRKAALPQLDGIFIYDAQGRWVVTSVEKIPTHANNADREYFKFHQQDNSNKVHIGEVIHSRSTGDLIIPISMRLNNIDGSFRGVVLATIRIDFFRQVYDYYNLGEHDVLGLMKTNGNILYTRPFNDALINKSALSSPLFNRLLKTAPSGAALYRATFDGRERIFGYASLKRYPLVVVAGYDKQQVQKLWFSDALIFGTLSLILLSLLFLLGFIVLHHIRLNLKNQLELTAVRDQLTMMNRTLQSLALLDGLTGLANRRQFDMYLQRSLERSAKLQTPLSLVMIDIDAFKTYNDSYGHLAGDDCLKKVGECLLRLQQHSDDLIARYGGEEFAIILPNISAEEALAFAQQVVSAVAALRIPHEKSTMPDKVVTISAGLHTQLTARGNIDQVQLVNDADKALYKAKNNGKNQVMVA